MHALAIGLAAGLIALSMQEKPSSAVPKKGDSVSVTGCIRAGAIESNEVEAKDGSAAYSGFVTLRIAGDKKVVNPIKKEHEGHADVLIGTLKSDLLDPNSPTSKRVGNTRITIGVAPQAGANPGGSPPMPVLDVKEIEHTGANCRA
jgi:hypothetical protein